MNRRLFLGRMLGFGAATILAPVLLDEPPLRKLFRGYGSDEVAPRMLVQTHGQLLPDLAPWLNFQIALAKVRGGEIVVPPGRWAVGSPIIVHSMVPVKLSDSALYNAMGDLTDRYMLTFPLSSTKHEIGPLYLDCSVDGERGNGVAFS